VVRDAQLVEQPSILDGNDGLVCKALDELDLLVGERPNLLAVNDNDADQFILLEHRHCDVRLGPSQSDRRARTGLATLVGAVDWRFCLQHVVKYRLGLEPAALTLMFFQRDGDVVRRFKEEPVVIAAKQHSEVGAAEPCCALQVSCKDRVKIAR